MNNTYEFKAWDLLLELEGFKSHPYKDSKGIWTIGIGTTVLPNNIKVTKDTPPITKEQAIEYVTNYMQSVKIFIYKNCKWDYNQNQFDAMCCFLYNTGIYIDKKYPNTYKALCTGINITKQMLSINNKGLLINRRIKEIELFNKKG